MPWNYVDATNLSPHERRQWIKMAKSFGYDVQAVFFDVPLEICMERNSRRERTVSDDVMKKMAERLRPPGLQRRLLEDHRGARQGRARRRRYSSGRRRIAGPRYSESYTRATKVLGFSVPFAHIPSRSAVGAAATTCSTVLPVTFSFSTRSATVTSISR